MSDNTHPTSVHRVVIRESMADFPETQTILKFLAVSVAYLC